jgi:FAD/FMN-containing dehydrogenase
MTVTWTNWSGSVTCQPQQIATPSTEAEVQELVLRSASQNQRLRVVGSGHSFTPICATDEVLVSLDHLRGVEIADPATCEATIRAGTKIHDMGDALWQAGLSLTNQGDVDVQSLAGAISTGTHGTGVTLGSLSTQVVGLRIATASGEVVTIDKSTPGDWLSVARVSLGMLGIITAVRMRLLPAYYLHERQWQLPIEQCLAELDPLIQGNRHFEFFWYPATDLAHAKALNPWTELPHEVLPAGERVERSYAIFPTVRSNRFVEMEYAVPAEAGPDCFREIRALMRSRHSDITWPVEYRTLAEDDIWLSAAWSRPTVTLSIHQAAALPYQEFFADAEAIFRAYQGRPHWGKLHNMNAAQLREMWPRWDAFQEVRRQLDPTGMFLNGYLRGLFSASGY